MIQRGRRPRRRAAARVSSRAEPAAWAASSFLAASRTSVASSATLRPARSTPPSSSVTVYEPAWPVRGTRRDRRPERLQPGEALGARRDRRGARGIGVGVEARSGAAVTGRARRLHPEQQGVAVAVDRKRAQPEDVARALALPPQPAARTGVEVDVARRQRGRERLGVEPADHQDPAIGVVLDDAGDEPVRAPRDVGGIEAASSATGPAATPVMPPPPIAAAGPGGPPRPWPP